MIEYVSAFQATSTRAATTHPIGGWVMAAILCGVFGGILAGSVLVTTLLDRQRQARTEQDRRQERSKA